MGSLQTEPELPQLADILRAILASFQVFVPKNILVVNKPPFQKIKGCFQIQVHLQDLSSCANVANN